MEEFDRDLIDAMDRRIAEMRSGSLAAALRHVPATDWTVVREGAARIFSTRTR